MFYKSGYKWYMNKTLCKNFQNIGRNKTGKFGVWDFWLTVWENDLFWENVSIEKKEEKKSHTYILLETTSIHG